MVNGQPGHSGDPVMLEHNSKPEVEPALIQLQGQEGTSVPAKPVNLNSVIQQVSSNMLRAKLVSYHTILLLKAIGHTFPCHNPVPSPSTDTAE